MKKLYAATVGISLAVGVFMSPAVGYSSDHGREMEHARHRAKNIIFMVPDGMGLADVTAARIFKNGPNGDRLSFEKLPVIGYQSTHSANSTVTDSAAAASAWAAGEKFNNGEISCHAVDAVCVDSPETILELAEKTGKSTGLVVTSTITHATPAAFGAHVNSRKCETEIARQYIEETGVDVLLGGGFGNNSGSASYNCAQYEGQDKDAIVAEAMASGYTYATTEMEMDAAVADGAGKVLGLFTPEGKTPEMFRVDASVAYPANEPTLPEMTRAALNILEKDKDGFFLMVEGSQIDWRDHANDLSGQIAETLAFDEAVSAVKDWVNENESRRENTLVIVVPDHETGGFAIDGPYGTLSEAGDLVQGGWTSTNHTAVDTLIWSQGPGSRKLGKALDNTDLFKVMKKSLR